MQKPASLGKAVLAYAGKDFDPSEAMSPHVAAVLSPVEWSNFLNTIKHHVDTFKVPYKNLLFVTLGVFVFGSIFCGCSGRGASCSSCSVIVIRVLLFFFLFGSAVVYLNFKIDKHNATVDWAISSCCSTDRPWSSNSVKFDYLFEHTNFRWGWFTCDDFRPKETRLLRVTVTLQPLAAASADAD